MASAMKLVSITGNTVSGYITQICKRTGILVTLVTGDLRMFAGQLENGIRVVEIMPKGIFAVMAA